MSRASDSLPLEHNQRGDSGKNQMKRTCVREGVAWRADGIRHDQLVGMLKVPNV